jgi:hypothetical protein
MKAFLLTVTALISCVSGIFAQRFLYPTNIPQEYPWEVGINAGFSVPTRPLGPAEAYQGRRTRTVLDYSLRMEYFADPHWMLNLDIGSRRWESSADWQLNDLFGQKLKSREVTFLIADRAINESVGINYVIPFYSKYYTFNRANVYFGINFGLVQTVNDGSIRYGTYNAPPDSAYRYVSRYDYGYGTGYSFGPQVGFTYYIVPRLGVNVDLAIRYVNVTTEAVDYRSENAKFHLLYFPETLGVRWRF